MAADEAVTATTAAAAAAAHGPGNSGGSLNLPLLLRAVEGVVT